MASLYSSHLLSASSLLQLSTKMALKTPPPLFPVFKAGSSQWIKECGCGFGFKSYGLVQNHVLNISCAINMAAGQSDDPEKSKLEQVMDKARKLWDSSPQPVKSFPWIRALDNFIQLILDLVLAVVKYLSVPLLVVTSLSEMSYCAHERKLKLVLFPFFLGTAIAGVLRRTALDISPLLKDAEVPWHLICMALFFTLLKLPGPYYPYWGRIFIPHFANGGLFRTLWFAFLWYRRPQKPSRTTLSHDSEDKL